MKRLITTALAALIITACDSDGKYTAAHIDMSRIDGTTPNYRFELLCDEDMDVVYMKMDVVYMKMGHNRGGITVRVDSTGAPVRCSAIRRERRR